MKDKILDWLGVIKDEDAHLYEEYIPTKEEKTQRSNHSIWNHIFIGTLTNRLAVHLLSYYYQFVLFIMMMY